MPEFMFATGIENSYPTIALPDGRGDPHQRVKRIDEMEKTRHYDYWRDDFRLVRDLGIEYLRYGPPYYKSHLAPGKYDWTFADDTFQELRRLGINPIADLCHFGVPDWVGGFDNPDWPHYFAEYAGAFAERYPWVQRYTPVNEIYIAATFSGQMGWWNERQASDRGFVTALKHLCMANVLGMREILRVQPDTTFIQSESSEYFHAENPDCVGLADFFNDKRFLALDLTYGYPVSSRMYEYLMDNGMTREEYHWFHERQVKAACIMGTDYYVTNEHLVCSDGTIQPSGEIFGYYVITRDYYFRYHLPVMHTETNIVEPHSEQWLRKEWANMIRLKEDGVPIVGFTWYSLQDQVDWDTALREDKGNINALGLFDLERNIRPVGEAYRRLIQQWHDILPTESISLRLGY